MHTVPPHPHATLEPRELVTLGLLGARTGVGPRACSRWRVRDYPPVLPNLPARTRLVRVCATQRAGADSGLADPPILGVADR